METKFYKKIFISPGIVSYEDCKEGITLLQKETIDKALDTLKGKPVIITHDGKEPVGEVVDCYYNAETGNYIAGMNIWDKEAQDLLDKKEYSISCTYEIEDYKEGGTYHNINYDCEPTSITFTNIAIVDNPRYNEARIKINSIINNEKEEMFGFKKNGVENKEVCNEDTSDTITFRGKSITPQELIRVIFEEAEFHKGKPVDDASEKAEDKPVKNETLEDKKEEKQEKAEDKQENKLEDKKENEEVDKRKDIDDVGGFLKSKGLNDEDIRYVMKLMEQSSYNKSTADTKDNGNEDSGNYSHLGRPGKVGGSKIVDTEEDKQQKTGEKELEKKANKPIENAIKTKRNSIEDTFKTRAERITEANKSFYC